jgi:hypothetical protein
MEIVGQFKLIGVCIHKYHFEASLEKMPTPVHTPVDPAGVTENRDFA